MYYTCKRLPKLSCAVCFCSYDIVDLSLSYKCFYTLRSIVWKSQYYQRFHCTCISTHLLLYSVFMTGLVYRFSVVIAQAMIYCVLTARACTHTTTPCTRQEGLWLCVVKENLIHIAIVRFNSMIHTEYIHCCHIRGKDMTSTACIIILLQTASMNFHQHKVGTIHLLSSIRAENNWNANHE